MLTKVSLLLIFLNIVVRFSFPGFLPRDVVVRDNVFTTDEILEMKKLLSSEKRVLLKAGPRPSGPRPTARQGPAARRPDGLTARRPAAHGPPRPGGPVSFNQFCSMPQSTCPQVSCPQGLQRPCPVALFRNTFATFPLCTRNCYNMFVPVL